MKENTVFPRQKTELITTRPALQETLKRALQVESAQKMESTQLDYDDRKVTFCNNIFKS